METRINEVVVIDRPEVIPPPAVEAKPKKKRLSKKAVKEVIVQPDKTDGLRKLALLTKSYYDIQGLRMQIEGRYNKDTAKVNLSQQDIETLQSHAVAVQGLEKGAKDAICEHLKTIPFYVKVLSDKERFRGIAESSCAIMLSMFDIKKADTPSKMWAFAGLSVVPCRRCSKCQGVVVSGSNGYTHQKRLTRVVEGDAEPKATCPLAGSPIAECDTFESGMSQRPTKGEKLPYCAFLRAKMIGVMGTSLLKAQGPLTKHYYDYKHRKETAGWGQSKGHRHNASIRYMVKMALLDIWKAWREFEGLPVRPSYHEEKQGGHGYKAG